MVNWWPRIRQHCSPGALEVVICVDHSTRDVDSVPDWYVESRHVYDTLFFVVKFEKDKHTVVFLERTVQVREFMALAPCSSRPTLVSGLFAVLLQVVVTVGEVLDDMALTQRDFSIAEIFFMKELLTLFLLVFARFLPAKVTS